MESWIKQLIAYAVGPVRELAEAVKNRIAGIWATIGRVFNGIHNAWSGLRTRARAFLLAVHNFVGEIYSTIRWYITVRVPALLRSAARTMTDWVSKTVKWASDELRKIITTLDKWAKAAVKTVTNALRAFRDWALARINALLADAARLIKRVFTDWGTPARLATWLAAAMWSAFLRLLNGQRDRIATWFLRSSTAFTLWLARALEDIIGRML